jgi:hypothetical protein
VLRKRCQGKQGRGRLVGLENRLCFG